MTTAFLILGEQAVLVDAGVPGDDVKILAAMAKLDVKPEDLSLIVVTHSHSDHCGGLRALHQATGAQIAVHEADAEVLRLGVNAEVRPASLLARLLMLLPVGESGYEGVEPDTVFGDELDLYPFGVNGTVIHTPGHTPGSASVFLAGGVAIVGDLIMGFSLARGPRRPIIATDPDQAQESIRRLLELGVRTFYAAHGGPWDAERVRRKAL
jgi:glyoxylase-like metal-dependent hydrolase (beta-lactamase superfamily II)